jgi:hypothetical protein
MCTLEGKRDGLSLVFDKRQETVAIHVEAEPTPYHTLSEQARHEDGEREKIPEWQQPRVSMGLPEGAICAQL